MKFLYFYVPKYFLFFLVSLSRVSQLMVLPYPCEVYAHWSSTTACLAAKDEFHTVETQSTYSLDLSMLWESRVNKFPIDYEISIDLYRDFVVFAIHWQSFRKISNDHPRFDWPTSSALLTLLRSAPPTLRSQGTIFATIWLFLDISERIRIMCCEYYPK